MPNSFPGLNAEITYSLSRSRHFSLHSHKEDTTGEHHLELVVTNELGKLRPCSFSLFQLNGVDCLAASDVQFNFSFIFFKQMYHGQRRHQASNSFGNFAKQCVGHSKKLPL